MRNIDSYDSRYPLEYYEIGTIYSFYCSSIAGKFKKADSEYISKYSSKLLELQKKKIQMLFNPLRHRVQNYSQNHFKDFMEL